jgi:dipeptidyl aminopeptidase/acylaminoacyl peptidase
MTHIQNVRTPTLLLQGYDDTTDPIGRSPQCHRGSQRNRVDAGFVLAPRKPHALHEEIHLLYRLNRITGWRDKYLRPPPATAQYG